MYESIKGGMKTVGYVMLPLALATGCASGTKGLETKIEPNVEARAGPNGFSGIWEARSPTGEPIVYQIEEDADGYFVGTLMHSHLWGHEGDRSMRGQIKDGEVVYCENHKFRGGWERSRSSKLDLAAGKFTCGNKEIVLEYTRVKGN